MLSGPRVRALSPSRLLVLAAVSAGWACADDPIAPSVPTAPGAVTAASDPKSVCFPTRNSRPVCPSGADPKVASFIDPTATVSGQVELEKEVYVGPFAVVLANNSSPISIGAESNVQDNVTISAASFRSNQADVRRIEALGLDLREGVEIAERVIMAHGSTVKGPAKIGIGGGDIDADPDDDQEVFLSFGSEVDGAILEKNTGVSALGRVGPGVRLRSGYIVLPGKNVTTQAEADNPALGKVRLIVEADVAFNEGVIEVNVALAREYTRLFYDNPSNVRGINFDPGHTEFNEERDLPTLHGTETQVPGFRNRIIGEVAIDNTLGELNRVMGDRISIRADEGEPFELGSIARMDDNVIFHALEGTPIFVGANVRYGARSIVHGGGRPQVDVTAPADEPTIIEDDVTLRAQSVVFRSLIGRGSTIGVKSLVVNTDLTPNSVIADRVIVANGVVFGPVEW